KQAFATEQGGFDSADKLDVVVDRRLEADDAAGVDAQDFARSERPLVERAAGVYERPTVAGQPLHDEAFAPEQTHAEFLLKCDPDAYAFRGAKERFLLHDHLAAEIAQVNRNNLARVGRAERDTLFRRALILEHGHEKRFAREQ